MLTLPNPPQSQSPFDGMADTYILFDWNWRYVYVNEAAQRTIERPREQILGRTLWDLYPDIVGTELDRKYRRAMEERVPATFDFYYPRLDAWWENHSCPVPGGLAVFSTNITERRRTEQELRERQEGDRALIELGLLGLHEQDPHVLLDATVQIVAKTLRVEFAKVLELLPDRSALKLAAGVGWKPGAVGCATAGTELGSQAGYTIWEHELAEQRGAAAFAPIIVGDWSKEHRFSAPRLLLEHGVVSGVTVVIPGEKGPWGVLGVDSRTPRRFERREAEFLQAAANLLSAALERCRTYTAMQKSGDRFRDLARLSSDWYWEQDADLRFTFISDGFFQRSGIPREGVVGKHRWDFAVGSPLVATWEAHRALLEAHLPFRDFELWRLEADGTTQYQSVSGEPVFDDQRRFAGYRGTTRDITARVLAQKALCEAVDELQVLSRRLVEAQETERRRLAAELHDQVGQNLTALSINLDILAARLDGLEGAVDTKRRLQDSLGLLEATSQCIEGMLNELRPPMLDDWGVGPTLQGIADDFRRRTEIPVRVGVLGAERRIDRENELSLVRIVQEALNNVAKHAHAGMVEILLDWKTGFVRVEVADNGIGFEHNGSGGRRGLGLPSMRTRIQAAHGLLEIESAPGKGTRVRASVPG